MERYVLIDGKVPFREARSIELNRIWCDYFDHQSYFFNGKNILIKNLLLMVEPKEI